MNEVLACDPYGGEASLSPGRRREPSGGELGSALRSRITGDTPEGEGGPLPFVRPWRGWGNVVGLGPSRLRESRGIRGPRGPTGDRVTHVPVVDDGERQGRPSPSRDGPSAPDVPPPIRGVGSTRENTTDTPPPPWRTSGPGRGPRGVDTPETVPPLTNTVDTPPVQDRRVRVSFRPPSGS